MNLFCFCCLQFNTLVHTGCVCIPSEDSEWLLRRPMCERWLYSGCCLSADIQQMQAAVFPQIMMPWLLLTPDDLPATDKDSLLRVFRVMTTHKTFTMQVESCNDRLLYRHIESYMYNDNKGPFYSILLNKFNLGCLFVTFKGIDWKCICLSLTIGN